MRYVCDAFVHVRKCGMRTLAFERSIIVGEMLGRRCEFAKRRCRYNDETTESRQKSPRFGGMSADEVLAKTVGLYVPERLSGRFVDTSC